MLFLYKYLFTINFLICFVYCVLDNDYALLPKKFELDDYNECIAKNELFCKIYIQLVPINQTHPSNVWKVIQQTNQSFRYFRHDELLHGKCVKKDNMENVVRNLNITYSQRYAKEGIKGVIDEIWCIKEKFPNTIFNTKEDKVTVFVILIYVSFMIFATIKTRNSLESNKYLSLFSFYNILKDIKSLPNNEDFINLKSMQGMRTLNMINIIFCHSFVANMILFSKNPDYFENFYDTMTRHIMVTTFGYLVQIYFLFSSWLLAVQFKNLYQKNGEITLRDVFLLAVNRYFRLIPAVFCVFFLHRHSIGPLISQDIYKELVHKETSRCFNYGWKNFLFIQNIFVPEEMCSPGTWYIAVDTQLYVLSLIILFLKYRYNIGLRYSISCVIVFCSWAQITKCFQYDIDGLIRIRPKLVDARKVFLAKEFLESYIHPYSNVQTYMLGLVFGGIYSNYKNKQIFNTITKKVLWLLSFIGLPLLTIYITTFQYSRATETLLGLIARPLFALGIAIGLLGMAAKTGGPIKRLLEWEPLVLIANFTYSTYMYHFIIVFMRTFNVNEITQFSDFTLGKSMFLDVILSFSGGTIMYILWEQPLGQLQKLTIPQPKNKKSDVKQE